MNDLIHDEKCDDGNNVNGDGCTAYCEVETGYTCSNVFIELRLEIPVFRTTCTKGTTGGGGGGTTGSP